MSGVFIGNSIEIVSLDEFDICFRRDLENRFLESILVHKKNNERKCIGYVKTFNPTSKIGVVPDEWIIHFDHEGVKIQNSECDQEKIGLDLFFLNIDEKNKCFCEMYDGSEYLLFHKEEIDEEISRPNRLSINESSLGSCLKSWFLGIDFEKSTDSESLYWQVTVNTNNHMYIYHIGKDAIYCRAARYFVSEKGVVFNQNFRQGTYAFMVEDNSIALNELAVNDSFFDSELCTTDSNSIYWSVKKVTREVIYLNGCEGQVYEIEKPVAV